MREGSGWHNFDQWRLFFDTIYEIGQISEPIAPEDVLSNKYVPAANDFDGERVKADATAYTLPWSSRRSTSKRSPIEIGAP